MNEDLVKLLEDVLILLDTRSPYDSNNLLKSRIEAAIAREKSVIESSSQPVPGKVFIGELTRPLQGLLGIMNFNTGPMAHTFRDCCGVIIPARCEDEQAFILHWLLTLYAEHGELWTRAASAIIKQLPEMPVCHVCRALPVREGGFCPMCKGSGKEAAPPTFTSIADYLATLTKSVPEATVTTEKKAGGE